MSRRLSLRMQRLTQNSIPITFHQIAIGIDSPISQKRPDPSYSLAPLPVDCYRDEFLPLTPRPCEKLPLGTGNEAVPPEFDAFPHPCRVGLEADPVDAHDGYAVGDGMAALN